MIFLRLSFALALPVQRAGRETIERKHLSPALLLSKTGISSHSNRQLNVQIGSRFDGVFQEKDFSGFSARRFAECDRAEKLLKENY